MITINNEDYKFLLSSAMFCERIEDYIELFHLDSIRLDEYKSDDFILNNLLSIEKYDGRGFEYFVSRKIQNMKARFNYFAEQCKNNKNYTSAIGRYLGIEDIQEEELYWFSEN